MGLFEHFPYTNFHELNLSWFLDTFRELLTEWEEQKREFADLKEAWEAMRTWITEYFDNLDVQEEINNKLDAMAADGSLQAVLMQFVPGVVTNWMNDNIVPTSPPVDKSLTIEGAAADAKVVGEDIWDLRNGFISVFPYVADEYVTPDGTIDAFPDWSRSHYVNIEDLSTLYIKMPRAGRTLGFYDASYNVVGVQLNLTEGINTISVPAGTKYFCISEADEYIDRIRYQSPEYEYLFPLYQNQVVDKTVNMWDEWDKPRTSVSGEYVDPNGVFQSYTGWTRTDYVDCRNVKTVDIDMPRAGRNICFYDAAHTFEYMYTSIAGENIIDVPVGSAYFAVSEDDYNFQLIRWKHINLTHSGEVRHGRTVKQAKGRKIIRSISRLGYDAGGTYPEQTLAAYQEAVRQGFNILLCDLSFTQDDVAICLHDVTINRTARNIDGSPIGTTISIIDHDYNDIKNYDYGIYKGAQFAGQKLLTLDDMLDIAKGLGCELYIEMKYCPKRIHAQLAVDIVRKHGMLNNVSWCSFFRAQYGQEFYLSRIIENDPWARVGMMTATSNDVMTTEFKAATEAVQTDLNEVFVFNWTDLVLNDSDIEWLADNNIAYEAGTLETENEIVNYYNRSDITAVISGIETTKYVASEVIKTSILNS